MKTLTPEQIERFKEIKYLYNVLAERARNFGVKKGSKKFTDMQAEFFAGALAEKEYQNPGKDNMDPLIVFSIMRGDDILEETENTIQRILTE